jgi:hypothetical protein
MSTSSAVLVLVFQKRNFLSISLDILSSDDGGGGGNEGKDTAIYCLACRAQHNM